MSKKRIAVIGGGLGSMTAIYNLLNLPDGKDKYDITVYQLGWRCGGKGASGVNIEKGCRVEEHGIHFWFGFYENAFRMMKELYGSLHRPSGAPLATFNDAFKPKPYMTLTEHVEGTWVDWKMDLPKLPGTLGDGKFNDPVEEVFVAIFNYLAMELKKYLDSGKAGCLGQIIQPFVKKIKRMVFSGELEEVVQGMEKEIEKDVIHDIEKHLKVTGKLLSNHKYHGEKHLDTHLENLDHLKKWIWDAIGDMVEKDTILRRVWQGVDFGIAM
ncbi:MAG: NAD(P)-binding protein, partial [Saprospiraceae bacterium]|nr:NAD(P)-binding protein [Saprospiraceae bacterium]